MIYCIGDSHVVFFTGQELPSKDFIRIYSGGKADLDPDFKTYWIGAVLAISMGNQNHSMRKKADEIIKGIPKGSKILFSFGEIDCRAHILKHVSENTDYKTVTNNCIEKYLTFIRKVKESGYEVLLWGPPPNRKVDLAPQWAFGDVEDRNKVILYFNIKLMELCMTENIPYFTLIHKILNKKLGNINDEYYIDEIHLHPKNLKEVKGVIKDYYNGTI
jgi:hypothetical protein